MNTDQEKGFITLLGETLDQWQHSRRLSLDNKQRQQSLQPASWGRWLLPNGGTIILVVLLMLIQGVWARSPLFTGNNSTTTISYQGRLLDSNDQPVNDPGLGISFRLYDVDTGGAPLWSEDHIGVPVQDGLFQVLLGSIEPIPISLLAEDNMLWLGVQIAGDTEMSPREQIASVPYAMVATTVLDAAVTTEKLADGAVTLEKLAPDAVGGFGGRPGSYPYLLHLNNFGLMAVNFCQGYVPGDPEIVDQGCFAYPGIDKFTAGTTVYIHTGNGYAHSANNFWFNGIDFVNQTVTKYPKWGYAYSYFLQNPNLEMELTLPVQTCNDIAIYVTQGTVVSSRLGDTSSLAYHRFPGNAEIPELENCDCLLAPPTITVPSGDFRLSFLTRGASCTSYLTVGTIDEVKLPIGNWVTDAGLTIDWPNLRTYLGEQ